MSDAPTPRMPSLSERPALRWPLRIFVATLVAGVLGLALLDPAARPWLLLTIVAAAGFLAWSWWDETRGRAAALARLRARWLAEPDVVDHDADLHFSEDRQPLIARLAQSRFGPALAILTPLPETTAAFRIASRHLPRPGFDGLEPALGGPPLARLPGLQLMLHDALVVEGNEPARLERWLDRPLIDALVAAARDHGASFRGLTFDGRFLAVHWLGDIAGDPAAARALSAPLWRPFVPRLPPTRPELLN
jgi:hypothetical protein